MWLRSSARTAKSTPSHTIWQWSLARPHKKGNYPTAAITETGPAQAFFQELRRLGCVEGPNLVIDRYSGEGQEERYDELAREVVRLKPDVIFAIAVPIALKIKAATATIPIVRLVADPLGTGLVSKLARSDSNFTGVTLDADVEIWGKRLELLKEFQPELVESGHRHARI